MKLWLIQRRTDLPFNDDPWRSSYDTNHGFVIRAVAEEQARGIAQENVADEGGGKFKYPWLSAEYSTCVPLRSKGKQGIVIRDFNSA